MSDADSSARKVVERYQQVIREAYSQLERESEPERKLDQASLMRAAQDRIDEITGAR